MNIPPLKPKSLGITARTALLSWLVAIVTLLIFVSVIIPQQKRIFLENLESKAHGVAVSLRDVAAGAAVNEDFSAVVDHCREMLNGDPSLDFLVITKSDGFSLINDRAGWRSEVDASKDWRPEKREPVSRIAVVPLFNQRVFHYAQPFDHSGIQWGWIHVGLSLNSYDESVAHVYQRTVMLAVVCIVLSLLVSVAYAKRLVQPILHLRRVVEQVAGGDLAARAEIESGDELGSLAGSVNAMTEALLRRDRILQSVRLAAQRFLSTSDWTTVIEEVLARIGEAAAVSRIRVFENQTAGEGLVARRRFEWVAANVPGQGNIPGDLEMVTFDRAFAPWAKPLQNGEVIATRVSALDAPQQRALERQGIKSLLVVPIKVEALWWGILTLVDCHTERAWTAAEQDSFRAAADMLGAAIARQRAQDALLEAKATLEQRVLDRTRELRDQVTAKEQALAELAEAQSTLVELSRHAGMAEVATGVLHNVGNVLNSVNVSCTLIMDRLRQSRVAGVSKLAALLANPPGGLAHFLTENPQGRKVPQYVASLAPVLEEERAFLLREAESLREKVDHIKEIVAMQQSYGRISGVTETVPPAQLVEDALKLNAGALVRHGVEARREFEPVPPITVDKHKVLQILLNLIRNAKYACEEAGRTPKIITLRIFSRTPGRVTLQVADNGIGITPENLTRIFQHGFTTRQGGHGFGLHSGALAARELGGTLHAASDGLGQGATFTLELPAEPRAA
ncbi:MAG TPA: ATP-binding protein [Verrucomicrobiae bacterium]